MSGRRTLLEANAIIREEKNKSEQLLLNVLPARMADELKATGTTAPELFEDVTVLFSDLVGFTAASSRLSPSMLIGELNEIFTNFDRIIEANGCERIKTIGDAYLAVCGMPKPDPSHARRIVQSSIEMISWLQRRNETAEHRWNARMGVHSGAVVGAVVGIKKYIYEGFGDTVNTASRMETNSAPMRINLSEATHRMVSEFFAFVERPPLEVKGKGLSPMYFVEAVAAPASSERK